MKKLWLVFWFLWADIFSNFLFGGGPPSLEVRLEDGLCWVMKDSTAVYEGPSSMTKEVARLNTFQLVWLEPESASETVSEKGITGRWNRCVYFGETSGWGYIFDAYTLNNLEKKYSQDPETLLQLTENLTGLMGQFRFDQPPPLKFLKYYFGVEVRNNYWVYDFYHDQNLNRSGTLIIGMDRVGQQPLQDLLLTVKYAPDPEYKQGDSTGSMEPFLSTGHSDFTGGGRVRRTYGPFFAYPWVTTANLRIRAAPGLGGETLGTLTAGTFVKILEQGKAETIDQIQGHWVRIGHDYDPDAGWCFDGYLKLRE